MIPRYTRPEMAAIWTDQHRYDIWLEIEVLAVEGWAKVGRVPRADAKVIRERAAYDLARIEEIEKITRHDVVAFTQAMAEKIKHPACRWIHFGMTSSDVLDTCLAKQLAEAGDLLIADLNNFLKVLKAKAKKFKHTEMIGRSHGIHAEPITFGLVMAQWYDETRRNLERMKRARDVVAVGQISGAVGTYAHLDPRVEANVMKGLGLHAPKITTQVLQRDRHAEFFTAMALAASSLEKFSIAVRHWQRTEVLEAEEFFHQGQKGSSAMPHKRNPIASENTTGLCRLVRSMVIPALENVVLWHERDISHSSVERNICPDATVTLDYALNRFAGIVDKLIVYPENMKRNLALSRGLFNSEGVLLRLVESGLTREQSYAIVQRNAMKVWEEGKKSFLDYLLEDEELVGRLGEKGIREIFDSKRLREKVNFIFGRVFGK